MYLTQSDPVLAMQFIPKESDPMTRNISGNRRSELPFSKGHASVAAWLVAFVLFFAEPWVVSGGQQVPPSASPSGSSLAKTGEIPKLPQDLEAEVKEAERKLDGIIVSPEDLEMVQKGVKGAEAVAIARLTYQGADWWESRNALFRGIDLERILEMSAEQRRQLVEVANNAGDVVRLYEEGRYKEAIEAQKAVVEVWKKVWGDQDRKYSTGLNNLAELYKSQGQYETAEPLFRQSLAIDEKVLGTSHPAYAKSVSNLAALYWAEGRYEDAEPLFIRVSEILEKALGDEHPDYATSLGNLAIVYEHHQNYQEAEWLMKKILEVRKKVGEDHDYAASLTRLARLYMEEGLYPWEAKPLLQRAVEIDKKVLGPEHLAYASDLNDLSALYSYESKYEEAEPLLRQASEILKNVLGDEHPDYGSSLSNLAIDLAATGRWPEAAQDLLAAARIRWKHLGGNLGGLAPRQQQRWLQKGSFNESEVLSGLVFAGHATGAEGLRGVLYRKQLRFEALRQQSAALRRAVSRGTDEWRLQLEEWQRWKQEYDVVGVRLLDQQPGQKLVNVNDLRELRERIETRDAELRQTNKAYAELSTLQEVKLEGVRKGLHTDEALVEYVRYRPYDYQAEKNPWGPAQYGAFVIRGDSEQVQAVHLGGAAGIDALVKQYRNRMAEWAKVQKSYSPSVAQVQKSEKELGEIAAQLRQRIWDPLRKALGRVPRRAYVAPDGELSLMPLEVLAWPTQEKDEKKWRYLADELELVYLNTGRDLARLAAQGAGKGEGAREIDGLGVTRRAVLVGAPDFEATGQQIAEAVKARQKAGAQKAQTQAVGVIKDGGNTGTLGGEADGSDLLGGLQPTFSDASQLPELMQAAKRAMQGHGWPEPTVLEGPDANLQEVLQLVRHPDILQFATHGYYAPREVRRKKPGESGPEDEDDDALLRSMLILAGYNHRNDGDRVFYLVGDKLVSAAAAKARWLREEDLVKTRIDAGNGVLTAYQVTGMDLEGTQLVNLTACETGVGTVSAEGVVGLREGFLLAGARALTMSMWEVPAEETTRQMEEFYDRWLGKGKEVKTMPGYDAFRAAQVGALAYARKTQQSGHPFYWAGTVYVGDPGDLPVVQRAAAETEMVPAETQDKQR